MLYIWKENLIMFKRSVYKAYLNPLKDNVSTIRLLVPKVNSTPISCSISCSWQNL